MGGYWCWRGPAEAKIELARLVRLVLVLGLAVVSLNFFFVRICFSSRDNKTIRSVSSDSQNYSYNFPEWFKNEAAAVLLIFLFFILTISLKNHSNHKKL